MNLRRFMQELPMQIKLTSLESGTREEFQYLEDLERSLDHEVATGLLKLLEGTVRETGYPISTMSHSLQTATRALRDNAGDELVVAALFHDVADVIAPNNHAPVGAEILRPYVSERTHWVMAHHAIFQGFFFWHHVGRDQNAREKYRGHPDFEACADFCKRWDQNSFDPNYDTLTIDAFAPMIGRVLGRTPFSQGTGR
jgi:predicted HD phosphohydrolase